MIGRDSALRMRLLSFFGLSSILFSSVQASLGDRLPEFRDCVSVSATAPVPLSY